MLDVMKCETGDECTITANDFILTLALEASCTAQGLHQVCPTHYFLFYSHLGCVKKHSIAVTTMYTHILTSTLFNIMHHHSLHILYILQVNNDQVCLFITFLAE